MIHLPKRLHFGTAQHDGGKTPTEDRIIHKQFPNGYELYGVFDGHGGYDLADAVAYSFKVAYDTFFSEDEDYPTDKLIQITSEIYKTIDDESLLDQDKIKSGTTATIALVTPTEIIMSHVGDSPAILFDKKTGTIYNRTFDHTPDDPKEDARIRGAGGYITHFTDDAPRVNGRLMVTRAFGDFYLRKVGVNATPTVDVWPRQPDSILAIFSDGLTEDWSINSMLLKRAINSPNRERIAEKINKEVWRYRTLKEAAEDVVVSQANKFSEFFTKKHTGDNISLILVDTSLNTQKTVAIN
jgi:serine/threonine protein phosphatase PrpC